MSRADARALQVGAEQAVAVHQHDERAFGHELPDDAFAKSRPANR
jgi:hypothetical protein